MSRNRLKGRKLGQEMFTFLAGYKSRRPGCRLRPRLLAGEELVREEVGHGGLHQDEEGRPGKG